MIGGVAVLQDVLLDMVESDNPTRSYNVTDKAVEDGTNIADHMKEQPTTLSISGYLVNPNVWARMSRIIQYQKTRRLITYTNRVIHNNMAITNIKTRHDGEVANGLYFTIDLKHVRQARPTTVQITSVPPAVASRTQPQQNAGTRQVQQTPKQANNKESDKRLANIASGFHGGGLGASEVIVM